MGGMWTNGARQAGAEIERRTGLNAFVMDGYAQMVVHYAAANFLINSCSGQLGTDFEKHRILPYTRAGIDGWSH
jgi:hypothetical protein